MTICSNDAAKDSDETYWVSRDAAQPVLLIDEATDAITEVLHRIRSGSALDDRDLGAAGVALGDLLGGLSQLAELLMTSMRGYPQAVPARGIVATSAPVGALAPTPATGAVGGRHRRPDDDHESGEHQVWSIAG